MERLIEWIVVVVVLSISFQSNVGADDSRSQRQSREPIWNQIDELIMKGAGKHVAALPASDAEFLRRVYLDFSGGIPTSMQLRTFLADKSSDKRTKVIDQLLNNPRFSEHMADVFHVMLMERRGDDARWKEYLVKSFASNKPWNQLAREILNPDVRNEKTRASSYFMTKRLEKYGQNPTDYPGLTRDVGRLFMGVDLQCAQCHKHLSIDDYKQVDFQGLFVAYKNLSLQKEGDFSYISENLMTDKYEYSSVFGKKKKLVGPRVPFGQEIEIVRYIKGDEYAVAPDRKKKIVGVPKFSPLAELAQRITAPDHELFARNMANRIWFILMGRGLVHPLDNHHSDNPPSHPHLLDLLAKHFVASGFDIKWLMRQIASTNAYRRAGRTRGKAAPSDELFLVAKQRRIHFESLLRMTLQATGHDKLLMVDDAANDRPYPELATFNDFHERFKNAFANERTLPEDSVEFSLKASLFWRNDKKIWLMLQPSGGNLVARVLKIKDDRVAIEELFLSVLTRLPTDAESSYWSTLLSKHKKDRAKMIGRMTWAMLASAEYQINH